MPQALLQSTMTENVQVLPVDPEVKSPKTRELFNAGVSEIAGSAKSADPSCYDVPMQRRQTWETRLA